MPPPLARKSLLIVVATLVIMVIPFLTLDSTVTRLWRAGQQKTWSPGALGLAVVGLLAADLVLPIPSSVVGTYAGAELGSLLATLCVWFGLTSGAVLGFAAGRAGSPWMLARMGDATQTAQLRAWHERWGASLLVVARGLPLFAEASVVLAGLHGLSWRQFLPAVMGSNLGLAIAYSIFGSVAAQHEWLAAALAISAGLPPLVALLVRRRICHRS